jgi:cysteinyl-tRNA synthetase
MDIFLYNTLSKTKETFTPLSLGKVGMYTCGPTVYDRAHIGNLRSYVFADTLRRTFEYNGYVVRHVINITDVGHLSSDADDGDDKMTKALLRDKKPLTLESMYDIGSTYLDAFVEDLKKMNIELPAELPRASENINEVIELIMTLEHKGVAYKTSDGMYFDTKKYPSYGKLGNINIDSLVAGSRVTINPEKHSPSDFALWKFDQNLGWESSWGRGFPGWHIECSAMSRKYLGQPFDIHTGGIDHIPTHHNNEIAQSEVAYDNPLAHYWLHNEFIRFEHTKMAKSSGGFITLDTLIDEIISPITYRYWLLTAHYRSPADFSYEAVRAAQSALLRLLSIFGNYADGGTILPSYKGRFQMLINDDLDMPRALALAWELIKDSSVTDADKKMTLLDFDKVFGLNLATIPTPEHDAAPTPPEIQALADAREEARTHKDWVKADALRSEIESRGYSLLDTEAGVKIIES